MPDLIIDPRYVDCDFTQDPLFTMGDLGPTPLRDQKMFADEIEVIPESQWRDLSEQARTEKSSLDFLVRWVLSQLREGSCVGNAWTQALMLLLAKTFGIDKATHLSAISLYKQIGRSPSSGAMVDDGMEKINEVGILPLDTPENRAVYGEHVMPATGFHTPFPDGWKDTAKLFRGVEKFVCNRVAEVASALLANHPVIVGRAGHSIVYVAVIYVNGKQYFLYCNSWGKWGIAAGTMPYGFGMDSGNLAKQASSYAFALRTTTVNQ